MKLQIGTKNELGKILYTVKIGNRKLSYLTRRKCLIKRQVQSSNLVEYNQALKVILFV